MRNPRSDRDAIPGTGEFKAVAEEAMRLGARALEKGREWWNEMTDANDRRDDMRQQQPSRDYPGERTPRQGRDWDERGGGAQRARGRQDPRNPDDYLEGREDSWTHDQSRYAERAGEDDRAYRLQDQDEGRDPYGRRYARPGERSLYGAHGPDLGRDERHDYYDSGWRAGGFDERSQTVGWEDDRGDAPYASPGAGRFRGAGGQYGERSRYGGESAGRGGRAGLYDYSAYGPRRGEQPGYERLERGARGRGEGYGGSSGYGADRSGFAGSAYGAGFEANAQRGERGYQEPGDRGHYDGGYRSQGSGQGYREQGLGGHRGRGPQRYSRSDERILEDVNERLTEDDLIDASDIQVRCSDGRIVLEGEVDDRWMKHRAEDIADACSGVKDVDNRIRVRAASGERQGRGDRSMGREGEGMDERSGRSAATGAGAGSSAAGSGASAGGAAGATPGSSTTPAASGGSGTTPPSGTSGQRH